MTKEEQEKMDSLEAIQELHTAIIINLKIIFADVFRNENGYADQKILDGVNGLVNSVIRATYNKLGSPIEWRKADLKKVKTCIKKMQRRTLPF